MNDLVGEFEASTGNTSDMCELIDGFLALKLNENLAKLVGIILATAVALTGQIVDRLRRQPVVVKQQPLQFSPGHVQADSKQRYYDTSSCFRSGRGTIGAGSHGEFSLGIRLAAGQGSLVSQSLCCPLESRFVRSCTYSGSEGAGGTSQEGGGEPDEESLEKSQ